MAGGQERLKCLCCFNAALMLLCGCVVAESFPHLALQHCFGSGSELDPHSIDFLDPGGVKSSKTEGEN
jgi:hypothetical protein